MSKNILILAGMYALCDVDKFYRFSISNFHRS